MTEADKKRQEIREGVAKKCEAIWYSHDEARIWGLMADGILLYLDSQDVVMKVEKPLPENPHKKRYAGELAKDIIKGKELGYSEAQQDMANFAPYERLVEPLKEGGD